MHDLREWLEADGLGGFASGTAAGIRTRRYHALLLAARTPPTGRMVLVNGVESWVATGDRREALSTHRYAPDVLYPDGASRLRSFRPDPWPTWRYELSDGTEIVHEIIALRGAPAVLLSWRATGAPPGTRLTVRPLLTGRDTHSLHRENGALRFDASVNGARVSWQTYPDVPRVTALSNGRYEHAPLWFRNALYAEEQARGLDFIEDLASPGEFSFDLDTGEAVLVLSCESSWRPPVVELGDDARLVASVVRDSEQQRRAVSPSPLHRAAADYLVRRGAGQTVIAGYPWFSDWGRDTFIALRGLCIATGQLDTAREILLSWADHVSEGMLPNYFPEGGQAAEYNSVDASLWYVVAVHEFLAALRCQKRRLAASDRGMLRNAVGRILEGYARGTRFGIRADGDGLLAAGVPGVQLTWMDAKVGDWVVTPRIGKPVEIQALWYNALRAGGELVGGEWRVLAHRVRRAFRERFWNAERGCLHDVVDVDHVPGANDSSIRPNQLFAVGGLPCALVDRAVGRRVVQCAERLLWTPAGVRSLAPDEPGYTPRYEGGVRERDGAYHQGTVWPWLAGAFIEGWVRVHGDTPEARREARERFLVPMLAHLDPHGTGHLAEIADAASPHAPRGCPAQAWSVGEALRLEMRVLSGERPARRRRALAVP